MKPLDDLAPGDALPALELPPVTRAQLALFAGASGDHNPIHIDIDYARAAGQPDVFAHGMLVMAELGRLLTARFPIEALRAFSARFVAVTRVHDRLVCRGTVVAIETVGDERRARLDLSVADRTGDVKIVGAATVALSSI